MARDARFFARARAGDGALRARRPTTRDGSIGMARNVRFHDGSPPRRCAGKVVCGAGDANESVGNAPRRSMGSPPFEAAARTVMRFARTGAERPALRAPVRSTLAANCWVAMAEDMVRE